MLRDSDYNRLAASFHQFLQEYSCDAECEGLGMPEDAACSNFIHYYKLVLIVLWRQALEFVFPKYARPVFKQFMAQLQQSLPASQRKKQYSALMDTLGTISALLQQDQGVIKLAQQCVATFAAQNSEDPAARVMRLTRQTLEHLQRHVDQLTGLREQDFNDLSSALAVAFAPPANSPDPALKATSKAPAATPQAASVAVTEEDPEADIETLDDLVTTSEPPFLTVAAQDFPQDVGQDAPSAPDAAPQAVPEIVPEIVPVIEAEVALQAAPEFEPESEPEFEFVESSEHDAADPTAESPPPAAVSVDGVEIQFETAADDIPEAIIIPLDAAEPELLDLPEPPPPPASAEEPDAQEWRDTDDATPAASEEAFHEHGADPEAGEAFSIILDTDDADSPGMDPALDDEEAEEYALDLDDSMDDDPGHAQYEARPGGTSMPAPPPESLFEISAPPPQHLSHGRRAHSPPLVGSQRDNASRSARSNAAPQASPPKEPRVQPPPPGAGRHALQAAPAGPGQCARHGWRPPPHRSRQCRRPFCVHQRNRTPAAPEQSQRAWIGRVPRGMGFCCGAGHFPRPHDVLQSADERPAMPGHSLRCHAHGLQVHQPGQAKPGHAAGHRQAPAADPQQAGGRRQPAGRHLMRERGSSVRQSIADCRRGQGQS
ncbi:hypothetical protein JCM14635_14060 [Megalodesulfovibrio paquesii]